MECASWKEAILKSLENIHSGTAKEVFTDIEKNCYYPSSKGKTPEATVQAQLGDLIRNKDVRIKRVKNKDNVFYYYLTKYEDEVEISPSMPVGGTDAKGKPVYVERDLHPLLCTFLREKDILTRTIFHEQSKKKEEYQKWIHPDIVGVRFIEPQNSVCRQLFNVINHKNRVDIYSYELKKAINSDYELKKAYFQAVSNSSWANYGYLVAMEIGDNLRDEIERLNQSFGIGVIHLKGNAFESEIFAQSRRREIDFKTMDKLCKTNDDFEKFYGQVEKALTADTKFSTDVMAALKGLCDKIFENDSEIEKYCKSKNIPFEK
ncbi:MAG: hypothetical protein LUC44_03075 [Prevotellaceae bacterium]|nr:hypothetical protein [Prevotellaceae bacterium]